jgi:DNA-binding transcriptional ArsR family regulator
MTSDPPQLFAALNHVLRRRILRTYEADTERLASPTKFAEILDAPLSNVNYHVTVLVSTGVLALVETRPVRGAKEHLYRLCLDGETEWVRAALEASRESDDTDSGNGRE